VYTSGQSPYTKNQCKKLKVLKYFPIGKDSSRYLLQAYVKSFSSDFQKLLRRYRIRVPEVTPVGKKSAILATILGVTSAILPEVTSAISHSDRGRRARHTGLTQLSPRAHGSSSQDSITRLWRTSREMCWGVVATMYETLRLIYLCLNSEISDVQIPNAYT